MICPRSLDHPRLSGLPEEDHWRTLEELGDPANAHFVGTCSYCGSLRPEEALRRIEEGHMVATTDKSYKMYLRAPDNGPTNRVYFQHFDEDQRREFVMLVNERKVVFEGGIGFYTLPFFMTRA